MVLSIQTLMLLAQLRICPTSADCLPLVQAARAKRSAARKDTLPDEAFSRLKGALFFGPGFKVTRNKLLFRDNLQELLAAAVPGMQANVMLTQT